MLTRQLEPFHNILESFSFSIWRKSWLKEEARKSNLAAIGWSTWQPPLEITNQIFYCGNLRFPAGESGDSRCTSWKCHFQPWKLRCAPLLLFQPTLTWWASARIYSYFIYWSFLAVASCFGRRWDDSGLILYTKIKTRPFSQWMNNVSDWPGF